MIALKCSQTDHMHASKNCLQCWCPIRAHVVSSGDGRHAPALWILAISPRKKKEADPFVAGFFSHLTSHVEITFRSHKIISNNALVFHFLLSSSVGPSNSCASNRMSLSTVLDHIEKLQEWHFIRCCRSS
jgi:hypothetical protein